jgi:hypothetical protein
MKTLSVFLHGTNVLCIFAFNIIPFLFEMRTENKGGEKFKFIALS